MVTRFKRRSYADELQVPKWHIAVQDYKQGEIYRRYLSLCGYQIEHPWAARYGVLLSKAKRVRGPQCSKCIKKLAETKEVEEKA